MRNAIIAAVVAALVSSGGTYAATRISGKAIKVGSIPANRLTASATAALTLPTVVTGQATVTSVGQSVVAQCPVGDIAVAGGYRLVNAAAQPQFILYSDGTTPDGTGWQIVAAPQGSPDNPGTFAVTAACEPAS